MKPTVYDRIVNELDARFALFPVKNQLCAEAATAIRQFRRELKDCRNELCLKCGNYKLAHKGACDDCRWRDVV